MGTGPRSAADDPERARLRLFLCGDVMTGRGIDQILPWPGDPRLYEPCARSATDYVRLAEDRSGPLPRSATFDCVWGDALAEFARFAPDLRLVNLETAVTARGSPELKGINYRMHPRNIDVLRAADIDLCALANNHVLDWGADGLADTLSALDAAGIRHAGAGRNAAQAWAPAVCPTAAAGRLLVFACATADSGVPADWPATDHRPGVALLADLSADSASGLAARIGEHRRSGDRVVVSVHWGGNWGFAIAPAQRAFAHALIDTGAADVVHGHSSHHVKGIELYRGRLVLYGCGDFLNDYEGIGGHEEFRGDLGLMYFPLLAADGRLLRLDLVPTRIRRFRVERAGGDDQAWLVATVARESARLGTHVQRLPDGCLAICGD